MDFDSNSTIVVTAIAGRLTVPIDIAVAIHRSIGTDVVIGDVDTYMHTRKSMDMQHAFIYSWCWHRFAIVVTLLSLTTSQSPWKSPSPFPS